MRRTPEVLVKVTGRKKGVKHLAAHLDYIGRHGDIETRDGEQITTKADMEQIADEWSDPLYWRQGTTVSAVAMVFSMPAGTDPEKVKEAVRETTERLIGDNHDYLLALHTDTPRPHAHLTVQVEGMDRKRFDPRREDLFRFREAFADALRNRGVEAEATPRHTRGQGRAGTIMALTQLRARIRSGASHQPTEADLRQAREAMQVAWGKRRSGRWRPRPANAGRTRSGVMKPQPIGSTGERRRSPARRRCAEIRSGARADRDGAGHDAPRFRKAGPRSARPNPSESKPGGGVPRGTPPPPTRRR